MQARLVAMLVIVARFQFEAQRGRGAAGAGSGGRCDSWGDERCRYGWGESAVVMLFPFRHMTGRGWVGLWC